MEISNTNNASKAGDIATSGADTATLGATSTATSPGTTGYAPDPTLSAGEGANPGTTNEVGSDVAPTSSTYGTDLADGVQLSGNQRTNNVEAVNIHGFDVGSSDK